MKFSWRIWLLVIVLSLSLLVLAPNFEKGVLIKSVEQNSTASESGLTAGEIITSINGEKVETIEDYTRLVSSILPSENPVKLLIGTKTQETLLFTNSTPEITVSNLPKTKIKTGLDLSGGARALVDAEEKELTTSELNDLIAVTSERLNVYGLNDVQIKPVSDLSGKNYMLVEIAGSTPKELESLIGQQGKFEAKIGNETVFEGGNRDITYVARTGQESGIYSCTPYQDGEVCNFRFAISLSEEAAQKHAKITSELGTDPENPQYLDKKLDLYLDDRLVDSLYIGKDLKGSSTTQISISGSGTGATREEAYKTAEADMKQLQTVLISGSLPFKLKIEKLDTISPVLGKEFTKNMIIIALTVFLIISVVLFIKYRRIKLTLAVILTMFSEAFITLAIAALIRWNLDAPSIAGIIAGIGTGVNDQIVIIDEAVSNEFQSIKQRIKNALFIIIGAFFTIIAAMLPLFWAGAGMLKGFALTTIIGVSVGILITRPAFSDIVKNIIKE